MMMSNDYIDVNLVCKQISGVFLLNDFYILPARKTWKTFPCRSNTKIVLKKVWKTSVISDLQTAGAN